MWVLCTLCVSLGVLRTTGYQVCSQCPVCLSACALSVSVGFVHSVWAARALGVSVCFFSQCVCQKASSPFALSIYVPAGWN